MNQPSLPKSFIIRTNFLSLLYFYAGPVMMMSTRNKSWSISSFFTTLFFYTLYRVTVLYKYDVSQPTQGEEN